MTAIDGQDVAADLARVAAEGVDHVSAYVLTIEDGTPFARDRVRVDGDAEAAALDAAEAVLGDGRAAALRGVEPRPTGPRVPTQPRLLGQPLLARPRARRARPRTRVRDERRCDHRATRPARVRSVARR